MPSAYDHTTKNIFYFGGKTPWSKFVCAVWAPRRLLSIALSSPIPAIEEIGTYNPCVSPAEIKIDAERAQEWIKTGAQPTDTVRALLKRINAI